ncbi:site-specific DNA-methyltransferase [Campylobacter sp. MIT 12-8780]|uniref:DNA-methyltransferase n=1 Tax=Campylobacter sp. MIT 12-8780 TaxID=2202200 RepID=UPI00115F4421|nr:site-specific DNA-methyltransferase [Campylobacter sp. MIT 12-8780]TQR42934.1 site-specific DNA-methyltransferase [Campylobacter sp. MIT 12-8780]
MQANIVLKQDEALHFLQNMQSGSVDLVVCDPPYLMQESGGGGFYAKENKKHYDKITQDKSLLMQGFDFRILDEVRRVMKVLNAYFFCNAKLLQALLEYFKNDKFDVLVYHKLNALPAFNNKYLSDLEYIVFVCNDRTLFHSDYKSASKVFSMNIPKKYSAHPAEKPLKIIETLIKNSSKKGDLVLDMFAGSGTTAVACKSLKRSFVGCEVKEEFYNMALNRLEYVQTSFDFDMN